MLRSHGDAHKVLKQSTSSKMKNTTAKSIEVIQPPSDQGNQGHDVAMVSMATDKQQPSARHFRRLLGTSSVSISSLIFSHRMSNDFWRSKLSTSSRKLTYMLRTTVRSALPVNVILASLSKNSLAASATSCQNQARVGVPQRTGARQGLSEVEGGKLRASICAPFSYGHRCVPARLAFSVRGVASLRVGRSDPASGRAERDA